MTWLTLHSHCTELMNSFYCITKSMYAYTGHWIRLALLILWSWSLIFTKRWKISIKKKSNNVQSFKGFRNKGKKLNSELLILKVSVLLCSPGHIRRWVKGIKKLGNVITKKSFMADRCISFLIFLIQAFYKIYLFYRRIILHDLKSKETTRLIHWKLLPSVPILLANSSSLRQQLSNLSHISSVTPHPYF